MYQAGLVLEGGGMKGVYTAGVLDFFTEKGGKSIFPTSTEHPPVHAICAAICPDKGTGAECQCALSGYETVLQPGSHRPTEICSMCIFRYHLIPDYLYPYDYDTFEKILPGGASEEKITE